MGKRETLQRKLDRLTKEFAEGHTKLESLKKEMQRLRKEINETPILSEIRPDEIILKS